MSISVNNLSILAYANNFTLWHYKAENDDPRKENYFNSAASMMHKGDLVITMTDVFKGVLILHDVEGGKVTVKEFL